jgi:DNA-binding NarL/FixJ family response regulator
MTGIHLSTGPPHFLLVEDSDLVARAYQRALGRHGIVSVASTVAEALVVVSTMSLTGVVSDVSLPDGTGLDVAARAVSRSPGLPILLISGAVDHSRLRQAHELGASFLLKPVDSKQLAHFADRAIARQRRAATLLEEWVRRYRLTPAETVTLRLAIYGMHRDEIAKARGVRPLTVRNQAAGVASKVGGRALTDTVAEFYRELWTLER